LDFENFQCFIFITQSVHCDTGVVTALPNVEEIHDTANTGNDMREENNEVVEEKQPVPTFGEAVASFGTVQQYMSVLKVYDTCVQ
jgi:hypothetical protein